MSPEQLNNQFRAAAALPPELDLAEATLLFLNPPPPAPKPWYKNPMIMLSALALFLVTLFSFYPQTDPPEINNFPISATSAAVPLPIEPLPALAASLQRPAALPQKNIALSARRYPILGAEGSTFTAPARPTATTAIGPEANTNNFSSMNPPIIGSFTVPLSIFGNWEYWKKTLYLTLKIPKTFVYTIQLTPEESAQVQKRISTPIAIKRSAGTLILNEGKRTGAAEFVPDPVFRKQLNQLGVGDDSYDANDLPEHSLKNFAFQDIRLVENPKDLIWLHYFLADVDDAYVSMLQTAGYPATELRDLWRLAKFQINKDQLQKFLSRSQQIFRERPPLKLIPELIRKTLTPPLINITGAPQTDYQDLLNEPTPGHFLLGSVQSLTLTLPDSLREVSFTADPKLAKQLRPVPASLMVDTLAAGGLRTLRVKGRIWLYLDTSLPTGKIIIRRKADDALKVTQRRKRIILANECGAENIHVAVNPKGIRGYSIGKCAEMIFVEEEPGDRRVIR